MAALKINTSELGPWAAAIFFIVLGLHFLGILTGGSIPTIIGILAIITGVCQLIELK
jgi:hypothetical protein